MAMMNPPTIPGSVCRKIINCNDAPAAIGPYNQAVQIDQTLYISGQLGMDTSLSLVNGGIEQETRKAMENIGYILQAAGGSYKDVIKTTILLRDISNFSKVNGIYSSYFKDHAPARAAFQVAALPKGGNVEIEAIAIIGTVDVGSVFINSVASLCWNIVFINSVASLCWNIIFANSVASLCWNIVFINSVASLCWNIIL